MRIRGAFAGFVIGLGVVMSGASGQMVPNAATPLAACGPEAEQFNVSFGDKGDNDPRPDASKATIYVVEIYNLRDKGRFGRPTIRVGTGGSWLGATQGYSFLRWTADPGEQHVCAKWQSRIGLLSQQVSLTNFKVEAGKAYYLRVQITGGGSEGPDLGIDLQAVSEDEGRFLVSQAAKAISKPK